MTSNTDSNQADSNQGDNKPKKVPENINRPTLLSLDKDMFELSEWSDDNSTLLARMTFEAVLLSDEDKTKYPALANSLSQHSHMWERAHHRDFEETVSEAMAEYKHGLYFPTRYELMNTQVRRADSIALSLLEKTANYDSEMGFWWGKISSVTFNTQTGEPCELSDIVRDVAKLPALIIKGMSSTMQKIDDITETSLKVYFDRRGFNWTLDYDGITFYFDEHTLSESWHPATCAKVLFAGNEDVFYEQFTISPSSYIVGLSDSSEFLTDLDGDGKLDGFTYYQSSTSSDLMFGKVSEFGLYPQTENKPWSLFEVVDGIYFSPYYVKMADGTNLIYVFCGEEYSYEYIRPQLFMYELTPKTCNKLGGRELGMRMVGGPQYEIGLDISYAVATDPQNLRLNDVDFNEVVYRIGSDYLPVKK